MATKTISTTAHVGQTFVGIPAYTGTPTVTVNGSGAGIALAPGGIKLNSAAAQGDAIAVTFTPADDKAAHTEFFVPTTGQTIVPTQWCNKAQITPVSTLAALTVTLPPSPKEGQDFQIASTQTITALTLTGGTVLSPPTTIAANTSVSLSFGNGEWTRI